MQKELSREQLVLADYMSQLSEEAYCAEWMHNLEHVLWRVVTDGPFRYGRLNLKPYHIQRLKELSQNCGGWIRFDDEREEVFVLFALWSTNFYKYSASNDLNGS